MSNQSHIEAAAKRMQNLANNDINNKLHGKNEATTRLLIIDEVLDILGWSKTEYNPEQITSTGGYTDYRLTIDGQPRLIVEAKRIGLFEPLPRTLQNTDYANSFLHNSCGSEMQMLLLQCQRYCIDCGIPYAIATTGEVWVILVGFKYGVEWGKLRSFVFHSLKDVSQRFSDFYGLISRRAVLHNSLEEKFGSMVVIKPNAAIRPREAITNLSDVGSISDRHLI